MWLVIFKAFSGRLWCLEHPAEPGAEAAAFIWILDMLQHEWDSPSTRTLWCLRKAHWPSLVGPRNVCKRHQHWIGRHRTPLQDRTLEGYHGLLCRRLTQKYSDWLGEPRFLADPAAPSAARLCACCVERLSQIKCRLLFTCLKSRKAEKQLTFLDLIQFGVKMKAFSFWAVLIDEQMNVPDDHFLDPEWRAKRRSQVRVVRTSQQNTHHLANFFHFCWHYRLPKTLRSPKKITQKIVPDQLWLKTWATSYWSVCGVWVVCFCKRAGIQKCYLTRQ